MSDLNEIAVSHDETMAVRLRDGLRLRAVAASINPILSCCTGCFATGGGYAGSSCSMQYAKEHRHCCKTTRKDGRDIIWVPA